jgi:hypothetical protein
MSKDYLETLKFIFNEALFSEFKDETHTEIRECHSIVYEALQRLKSIDNTKPNEVLKIIRKCENSNYLNTLYPKFVEDLKTVENYILKSQEQEKLLIIIFKKQVDVNEIKILLANLKHCDDAERLKRYNASRKVGYKLKQEEFDLIKEWIEYLKNSKL